MGETEIVVLPAGRRVEGEWVREVEIRPVNGGDELALIDRYKGTFHARRVTELLARCLVSLGPLDVARRAMRALSVGDREALALHLHALTYGSSLHCLTECPTSGCGQSLEIDLSVDDLLQPPYSDAERWQEFVAPDGRKARFRLPTGDDQESVAELAGADLPAAEARLWSLCVEGLAEVGRDQTLDEAVSRLMEHRDPQAELSVEMTCPECENTFESTFDAGGYLLARLEHRRAELIRQVHVLASRYGWGEPEILVLPPPRRLAYVQAIEDELVATVS